MKLNTDFLPTNPRRTLRLAALASSAIAALVLASFSQASEPASGTIVNKAPLKSSPAQLQMAAARAAANDELPVSRLIVKMRNTGESSVTRLAYMASQSGKADLRLQAERAGAMGTSVLRLSTPLPMREARALAAKMSADSAVEYVVPEEHVRKLQTTAKPNDPSYQDRQWHFFAPDSPFTINGKNFVPVGGANLPGAWAVTTGTSTVRVAVIDTGILPGHPELAANVLPGYDFIGSDALASFGLPANFVSNDGGGRDADATDPGDWVTAAEKAQYSQCRFDDTDTTDDRSSWHGTHVAGTISAATNNAAGVAGIGWNVKIVPLRVLGKCGGSSFDIVDAMLWAAGIDVPGVPANPTPVDVMNLSLGGSAGTCSQFYQDAVNRIVAKGVTIVAASGNESGAVVSPANCKGVIAVTGHTIEGDNTDFSNVGPEVAISAPAGGDPNTLPPNGSEEVIAATGSRPGRFVFSTSNLGTTSIGAYGYGGKAGTSMSAPHVAGVAALIRSVKPSATPAEITAWIKASARPHPAGGFCVKNANSCGAGLLDAGAAVKLASTPVAPPPSGGGGGGGSLGLFELLALLLFAGLGKAGIGTQRGIGKEQ